MCLNGEPIVSQIRSWFEPVVTKSNGRAGGFGNDGPFDKRCVETRDDDLDERWCFLVRDDDEDDERGGEAERARPSSASALSYGELLELGLALEVDETLPLARRSARLTVAAAAAAAAISMSSFSIELNERRRTRARE